MVIKALAATLSVLRPARSTAINGREMKVYEIIDARLKGWQLCETQGGLRKGLLIRRVWFGISVKRLCSYPVNMHSSLNVRVMLLFIDKTPQCVSCFFFFPLVQITPQRETHFFFSTIV